jgi:integrase
VPEANLPFTYVIRKKGKEYWRFRRGALKAAIPGKPGDPAFHRRYAELKAMADAKPAEVDRQSFRWLIAQYRSSAEFRALAAPTQQDYDRTLDLLLEEIGAEPYRYTTRAMIKAVRDDHAGKARKAHKIKQMVSRLYSWADENDLVDEGFNPAAKIKRLKKRAVPIMPWSEEEIRLFMAHCPDFLRTAVLLALYTGQRREDVVKMGWTAFQGAIIRVVQSKTGEPLMIGCHKGLQKHLATVKTLFGGPIARTAKGRPFTANSLSQAVRRVVESIEGMPKNRSLHGLRYAAAARLNEAGCTPAQCAAVLGHRTYQMALKYMAQREASEAAVAKQENNA